MLVAVTIKSPMPARPAKVWMLQPMACLLYTSRTKEGNFWHKDIYPWQVWLDGTYMAQPFYMEYETRCNGMHGCIDSYKQFMNIQKHMKDPKTCLLYTSRCV